MASASIYVPIAYLGVLLAILYASSRYLRQKNKSPLSKNEQWFGPNRYRDLYMTMLHSADESISSDTMLVKMALLVRAAEAVRRMIEIRSRKPALNELQSRGLVGDDLLDTFRDMEAEVELEIVDVATEANALHDEWGQIIFQTASNLQQNLKIREVLADRNSDVEIMKQRWEERKIELQKAKETARKLATESLLQDEDTTSKS